MKGRYVSDLAVSTSSRNVFRQGFVQSSVRQFAIEALIGATAAASAAAARIGIEHIVGGVAPFILTFPAAMITTLVGGSRAGVIAAVSCQLLTIRYVFPNWVSDHGGISTDLANVILSTIVLAGTIWATESYRRAAALLHSQCRHQVRTLSLLNAEMDHRTKNNFQIAAGLLARQSLSSLEPGLAHELDKAALRLETIASVYQDLSGQVASGGPIDLADHLGRIVELLRTGAAPEHILISYRADNIQVPSEIAVIVGLIVNEWITNALKHAFDDRSGRIAVTVRSKDGYITVVVRDDGDGAGTLGKMKGWGSDLVQSLAEVVKAEVRLDYAHGTRCSLVIPLSSGS